MDKHTNILVEKLSLLDRLTSFLKLTASLFKARLSLLVVFSSLLGAAITSAASLSLGQYLLLGLGGFLVAGSASGANQWFERDLDKIMKRTMDRPLVTRRLDLSVALLLIGLAVIVGLGLLYWISASVAIISGLAWFLYVLVYTPMKRISPFAVFVGAIPGALPVLSGTVAAEGTITLFGFTIFALQFIWQFPHFWAIAWLADDDYKRAGFQLLPSIDGRKNEVTGWQSFAYSVLLIPVSMVMLYNNFFGWITFSLLNLANLFYIVKAWALYIEVNDTAARKLMFASFIYLPLALIIIFLGVTFGL